MPPDAVFLSLVLERPCEDTLLSKPLDIPEHGVRDDSCVT